MCFVKQKTAYEMRISDWSSDVCSSDLWLRPVFAEYGTSLGYDVGVIRGNRYHGDQHGRMSSNSVELFARGEHLTVSVTFAHSLERPRSEERRVGQECVSTCRSRWSPYHYNTKPPYTIDYLLINH